MNACDTDPTDTAAWERATDELERTPVGWTCGACHLGGTVEAGAAVGHLPGIETEPVSATIVVHDGGPAQEFACPWCVTATVLAVL